MKKHIANIITGSRIVFSLFLLIPPPSAVCFHALYLLCGLTDMVDGTIARKLGAVSKFGARLDTVSDFVFMFVCAVKILPILSITIWIWGWIIIIALTKILNILLVFIRKKEIISIHSVLNKITGFALFILPLTPTFIDLAYSVSAVCVLASIASMQEIYYIAKGQEVL